MQFYDRLKKREADGERISVGLVGCGQMGSGLVHVTRQMPGLETRVISDINVDRPVKTLRSLGLSEAEITVTNDVGEAEAALRDGNYVVTEDALLLTEVEGVDAVVEATGLTEVGAKVAWDAIEHQKHVVMLNVETDVTVGPILHRLAERAGVVYTVAAGDEPGVCKMLFDEASTLGFEVVCLGKGKNNPIDRDATPESCREEAEGKGMNPKMLSAFKDGSKTMVEMAAVSNATGLIPDVPGMHGPKVEIPELNTAFVPEEDGGIFEHRGCVEYTTGKVAPAVFAIVTTDDPRVHNDMRFVSMGPGPYYTLLRPYHLCNIETPLAIVDAVLYGERTVASTKLVSEVVPIAKRDLAPGDVLGEIGSADYYGLIYTYVDARQAQALPLGITPGGTVTQAIAKGELLTTENAAPDTTKFVYKLRQLQDAALGLS
jgi:predicted homoserine dehydrogenase-like protein